MSDVERKKKKGRSPGYPGITLQEAVEKAERLYNAEGRNAAPVDAILEDWGYKPKSGAGLVSLAALKKFGLLEDTGSGKGREAKLTEFGLSLVLAETGQDRDRLIREAALKPGIHREIWDKYEGHLPSEGTLRRYLEMERGFTPQGRKDFIRQFLSTISFARLEEAGTIPEVEEEEEEEPRDMGIDQRTQERGEGRTIQLPLPNTEWAALRAPFPISKEAWDQMIALLEVMKPALVQGDQPSNGHGPGPVESHRGEEEEA